MNVMPFPLSCETLSVDPSKEDLQALTSRVLTNFVPVAARTRSFFVSEIPARLPLFTNPHMLSTIFSGLMSAVVHHTQESCIRISARLYGHVVLMHVRNILLGSAAEVERALSPFQSLAEQSMGSIIATEREGDSLTVTFAFPNLPVID